MNIREAIKNFNESKDDDFQTARVEAMQFFEKRLEAFEEKVKFLLSLNALFSNETEEHRSSIIRQRVNQKVSIYRNRLIDLFRAKTNTERHDTFYTFWCVSCQRVEVEEWETVVFTNDDEPICEDAFNDYYFVCDSCDNIFNSDHDRGSFDSREDGNYCEDCVNENGYRCGSCDNWCHNADDCDCDHDEDGSDHYLNEYNDRVSLNFLGKEDEGTNSVLFYGIEAEVHTREDRSRQEVVEEFSKCFYCDDVLFKRDGSLNDKYGFEIVSTPATFKHHKEVFWTDFFKLNPNTMVKGYHGYNCGIHIHFSRDAFTDNQLRRINVFYNKRENKNLIVDIAGREGSGYCQFQNVNFNSNILRGERYSVVNFNNTHTVEVRVFRSNIKPISFFRYLEFVHSVNEWIRSNHYNDDRNLMWHDYFDYLLKNINKDYINLLFFLDDRKHFNHLEHIQEWKPIYTEIKEAIFDFRQTHQEEILLESEAN